MSIPKIVNCKLETRQNDVGLEYITASVEIEVWGASPWIWCSYAVCRMWPLLVEGVQLVANDNCFGVIVPASGRMLILGCITGHHSFLVSCSFTKHVLAQLDFLRHQKPRLTRTMSGSCRNRSFRKWWWHCTFLHSVRWSASLPRFADEAFKGFFRTFPRFQKSAESGCQCGDDPLGGNFLAECSSNGSWRSRRAHQLMDAGGL